MTEEMAPFRHLLKPKVKFEWTEELDQLFIKSKQTIVDKIIEGVALYDPKLPTCLATDFSSVGIGFFLLQQICSCPSKAPTCCPGGWRLCLVGSRFLHPAETRYAPIEGEALAVAYGLHQCRYFVLGCQDLTVAVDHKPLLNVLNDRSLADIQNRRLQNLKEKTLSYKFKIIYVPGRKHLGPYAASRSPTNPAERLILPGEPDETNFEDTVTTSKLRAVIFEGLASTEEQYDEEIEESMLCSAVQTLNRTANYCNTVTWDMIKSATESDPTMQKLIGLIHYGFPVDGRSLPANLRAFSSYSSSLYLLDGIIMLSDRIVIPKSLQAQVVSLLHAAHQSIDRMKSRAAESVFWPGIIGDITRTRWECLECNKMAKSNSQGPPHPPPEPEFPFQLLAADYFHFWGKNYVVVVDRYSNWPVVFSAENGAHGLIKVLRDIFATFGVAEEIASDGGKEFTADSTQQFLKDWCVRHRLSSVAYPHSNCRAELGVKQVKRIITGNISPSGSLNVDSFQRAMLSYRNTIDPVTKFSPALALFGRQIRDGLPILKGKYNPHQNWKELLDHREKALAKRHVAKHEAWSEHTKHLSPLSVGDKVFIQNQVGNHPRRWERTGVVVEVKDHDQYSVRVDATGRLTLRNRKFLRFYQPINRCFSQEKGKEPTETPTPA